MENGNLKTKLLDTAIKTMERNRTLLFAINLVAAIVIVVVYLERSSFDTKQREGHLVAFQERCSSLNESLQKVPHWDMLSTEEKKEFCGCSDLDKISSFVVVNSGDFESKEVRINALREIGKSVFRLHRIKNEMDSARLESANLSPLGFGLPVPRNDLVIICGVLLLMLYVWLAFSFDQHARITEKIKRLFPEMKLDKGNETQATINDLIELNFLFRTSKGGLASLFVKAFYLSAPIAMTIATINDFYPDATANFKEYINHIWIFPRLLEVIITLVLWAIGLKIIKSDKKANMEPIDPTTLDAAELARRFSNESILRRAPADRIVTPRKEQ